MKRKISLFICVLLASICLLAASVGAETYYPDSDGAYTVELELEANNEYILFALKGEYDQTNYIEAFNAANDDDIIYYEQKLSDENGKVVFDSFVPFGYYNATLVVGGTVLDEPYLAGYLSAGTASNTGSIEFSGLEQNYTVSGINGEDVVINVETQIYDSFGYPSLVDEEVTLSIAGNNEDVTLSGNVITISKTAEEQLFFVNASAGTASAQARVYVSREAAVHTYIEVYTDEAFTEAVSEIAVKGVAGSAQSITFYAKTFDQYGQEISDTYHYLFGGSSSTSTVTPLIGVTAFTVKSNSADVEKTVNISVTERPDYKDSALELFELIENSEEELAKLGTEKFVSSESGKDVYPENVWTTSAYVTTFTNAVETAKTALDSYGNEGFGDSDYSDEVTALTKALNTYLATFKAGTRKDVTEITVREQGLRAFVGSKTEYTVSTVPRLSQTTDKITWSSSDNAIATVDAEGVVKAVSSGTVTITATTRTGLTATTELEVYKKATKITVTPSSAIATYGGETVVFEAKVWPIDCTDDVEWTIANPDIAELVVAEPVIEDDYVKVVATVVPKSAGKCSVTATAVNSSKSVNGTLTVVMPEWETAAAPVADVESGAILAGTAITLSSETADTTIYYTLDGSTPSRTNGRVYKNPVAINQSLTLKAVAVGDNLYDSEVSTYEYEVVSSSVKVSRAIARRGEYVDVTVSVEDFENVKNAVINVSFDDSVLDLAEVEYVCDYVNEDDSSSAEPEVVIALDYKEEGFSYNGDVAVLTFRVREETEEGTSPVVVTASVVNMDGITYDAASFDGAIVVNDYVIGDANDDDKIGLADVLIIKQYLAGNEAAASKIILGAADVDADGDVDADDVLLLSKYCVGWNVTLG